MPLIYEVPTHLQVQDTLIAGLTARQLLRLMAGASIAYGIWDQAGLLPPPARLALAAVVAAVGLAIALIQPGGRPVDQWLFAAAFFGTQPRRWIWRLDHVRAVDEDDADSADWLELAPTIGWREFTEDLRPGMKRRPQVRRRTS